MTPEQKMRRRLLRKDLERLREEFGAGDPLALNEAFLNFRLAQPWIAAALRARLRRELQQSRLTQRERREVNRWFAFLWVREKNIPQEDAKALAGKLCGCDGETAYASYKEFKKKRKIPRSPVRLPRGFEAMTPADLPGGPSTGAVRKALVACALGTGIPRKQAKILANAACLNSVVFL